MFVRFIIVVLISWGLYNLISGILGLPPLSSIRAIDRLTSHKTSIREQYICKAGALLEPVVKKLLPTYQKEIMMVKLTAAGEIDSPELYTSKAVAGAGIYLILGLFLLPVLPPLGPLCTAVFAVLSVRAFFKDMKIPAANEMKEAIEAVIPRFTSYVTQSTLHSKDLLSIIEGYRQVAGKELGEKLDVLLTDMRTKNHEAALISFESSINSPLVSEFVRGLIGMEHGEDMRIYLQNLEARMNEHEITELKKVAAKRPDMLGPANWLLVGSIMVIYIAVLGVQLISGLRMFNF